MWNPLTLEGTMEQLELFMLISSLTGPTLQKNVQHFAFIFNRTNEVYEP